MLGFAGGDVVDEENDDAADVDEDDVDAFVVDDALLAVDETPDLEASALLADALPEASDTAAGDRVSCDPLECVDVCLCDFCADGCKNSSN